MNMQSVTNQEPSIDTRHDEDGLIPLGLDALAIVGGGEGMICIG